MWSKLFLSWTVDHGKLNRVIAWTEQLATLFVLFAKSGEVKQKFQEQKRWKTKWSTKLTMC